MKGYITNAYFTAIVRVKFLDIKKKLFFSFQTGYHKNVSIIKSNMLCYFVSLMGKVEKRVCMSSTDIKTLYIYIYTLMHCLSF